MKRQIRTFHWIVQIMVVVLATTACSYPLRHNADKIPDPYEIQRELTAQVSIGMSREEVRAIMETSAWCHLQDPSIDYYVFGGEELESSAFAVFSYQEDILVNYGTMPDYMMSAEYSSCIRKQNKE